MITETKKKEWNINCTKERKSPECVSHPFQFHQISFLDISITANSSSALNLFEELLYITPNEWLYRFWLGITFSVTNWGESFAYEKDGLRAEF